MFVIINSNTTVSDVNMFVLYESLALVGFYPSSSFMARRGVGK